MHTNVDIFDTAQNVYTKWQLALHSHKTSKSAHRNLTFLYHAPEWFRTPSTGIRVLKLKNYFYLNFILRKVMRPASLSETVFLQIVLFLALTYSVKSQGLCQNFYFVLNNHVVDGHALEGHVVQRRTVNTAAQCHVMCKDNCQCVSFNYLPSDQENNCELNDANKEMKPDALKVKSRAQYYGLVRSYIMEVN